MSRKVNVPEGTLEIKCHDDGYCRLLWTTKNSFRKIVSRSVSKEYRRVYNTEYEVHLKRMKRVIFFAVGMFDRIVFRDFPDEVRQVLENEVLACKAIHNKTVPMSKDPYNALFIMKTAPPEVIKASYKALCLMYHPDQGGPIARFRDVQEAYLELKRRFPNDLG